MNQHPSVSPELQLSVEQFYYREARLLDGRKYQSWLKLIDPTIVYSMPGSTNPLVNNRDHGKEEMLDIERELEGLESDGLPWRDENYAYLFARVERSYKRNSWAENPPARTRRIIGNVEITEVSEKTINTNSNFLLFYARPGSRDFMYAGTRTDELIRKDDSYMLCKREIIMDIANINVPTLGILL